MSWLKPLNPLRWSPPYDVANCQTKKSHKNLQFFRSANLFCIKCSPGDLPGKRFPRHHILFLLHVGGGYQWLCHRILWYNAQSREWNGGVSCPGDTPQSSVLIGFSMGNHPLWGTPILGNHHFFGCEGLFRNRFCNCNQSNRSIFVGQRSTVNPYQISNLPVISRCILIIKFKIIYTR